eukprot:1705323-Alexandrium_andersonii.AAC.1
MVVTKRDDTRAGGDWGSAGEGGTKRHKMRDSSRSHRCRLLYTDPGRHHVLPISTRALKAFI